MEIGRSIGRGAFVFAFLALLSGCNRTRADNADSNASSLIFGTASPEAQQALAVPVNFSLTEENFAEWEAAQRNLDALPRSALPSGASAAGNPIGRAVERLEASPRARTAIERTGLTVRDFVLETVALAQATEALAAANSSSTGKIPPENLQFVQTHQAHLRLARRDRQATDDAGQEEVESRQAESVTVSPMVPQPTDIGASESVDTAEKSAAQTQQRSERVQQQRDSVAPVQPRRPVRDSARDTIPPPR